MVSFFYNIVMCRYKARIVAAFLKTKPKEEADMGKREQSQEDHWETVRESLKVNPKACPTSGFPIREPNIVIISANLSRGICCL